MIQFMEGQQDGAICRYNWLHDTEKYGARFDHSGTADGVNGIMHHNLAWNCESGGIMVKGDNVKTWLNGIKMINLKDKKIGEGKGSIALQIHSGGDLKIRWRNIILEKI